MPHFGSLPITKYNSVWDSIFWSRLIKNKNNLTNNLIDELFKINELEDYDCLLIIFYKNNDEPSCTREASLSNLDETNQQLILAILKMRNISKHCNKQLKLIKQDKLFKKRVNLNDKITKLQNLRGEI